MKFIHRKLEDLISKNSTKMPVIMLVGPRQCGKSTILNFLADEKKIIVNSRVNLKNPTEYIAANNDPEAFLQNHKLPILIVTIQP